MDPLTVTLLMPLPETVAAVGAVPRSPHWPGVRARHLKLHPTCAACGGKVNLDVHHVVPVSVDRSHELDPENLLTLCTPHHLTFGHAGDWSLFVPEVRDRAALHLADVLAAKARFSRGGG